MAAKLPLRAQEIVQLPQLQVSQESLKFRNVSIESEKYLVVRDEVSNEIKLIELATKLVTKIPV